MTTDASIVRYVTFGRQRVSRGIVPRVRLDAGGTRLRLRALHVMGHGTTRIARALGVRQTTIQDLVSGDARTVSVKLRDAVTDLYDAWWDKRAPERTRAERAAAPAPAVGMPLSPTSTTPFRALGWMPAEPGCGSAPCT